MTKKDYELFANAIHNNVHWVDNKHDLWVDSKMSDYVIDICKRVFAKDNPAFQAKKFERACYEGKHIRKSSN